jgi:aldose 1-epimerase
MYLILNSRIKDFVVILLCPMVAFISFAQAQENSPMKILRTPFGQLADGRAVTKFTLSNRHDRCVSLTDYGAIVISIDAIDRQGQVANVNAGFEQLDGYLLKHPHFGSTIGRFANRIAKGVFSIDGREYRLATNNGPNHLHGGLVGFNKQLWQAQELIAADRVGVRFELTSPDGQEGYPGTLQVAAEYWWDDEDQLTARFLASTDRATHLNLTNHAYFNLGGIGSGKITEHVVKLDCDHYLAVDETLIPTGEVAPVAGTPLDFRNETSLGARIDQLSSTKGYDHCFVINGQLGQLRRCAMAYNPKTGRALEITTTQPGVQLYTGNHLPGNEGSAGLKAHEAFCLETQHYPDSPNQASFPTTLLRPGEKFEETTIFRFFVRP